MLIRGAPVERYLTERSGKVFSPGHCIYQIDYEPTQVSPNQSLQTHNPHEDDEKASLLYKAAGGRIMKPK